MKTKEELRAKRNATRRARRRANPEKARQEYRDWRAANAEKAREAGRRWRSAHPDEQAAMTKRWIAANKERHVQKGREWRETHQGIIYGYRWGGFGLFARDAMIAAQENRCAICHGEFGDDRSPQTDHDHLTKAVRGILCPKCNKGLGMFGDVADRLREAADYLDRSTAADVPQEKSNG